jgi:hypothetical protein
MTEIRIEVHGLNSPPRQLYQRNRQVTFIGGEGIVRSSSFEGGTWKYLVEMPQGTKPTFSARRSANGRVGAETMVLLNERELCAA